NGAVNGANFSVSFRTRARSGGKRQWWKKESLRSQTERTNERERGRENFDLFLSLSQIGTRQRGHTTLSAFHRRPRRAFHNPGRGLWSMRWIPVPLIGLIQSLHPFSPLSLQPRLSWPVSACLIRPP